MALDLSSKQSLCLLRLSAIGDVCHAVAMIQAVQQQYPHLSITWVIGKVEYQLVQHLPKVNFVIFDKSLGWGSYLDLRRKLSGQTFDVLLHMQVALRANLAALVIKARIRIGFDRARAKEGHWLVTNHRIDAQAKPHVLEGFMGFAKAVGVQNRAPRWQIPIPESDSEFAKSFFTDKPALVICAAASKAERNWLPERYAQLAEHAISRGYQVLLCGGPSQFELELAEQIQNTCKNELNNLVGKTSLLQLLAVLKRADIVLAPDTGAAHMATTQGTSVIGLYAHSNPGRTGPYHSLGSVVSVYDAVIEVQQGKTVSQLPWGIRAKGADLMAQIQVKQVIAQFDHFTATC